MVKKVLAIRHLQQKGTGDGTFWEKTAKLSEEGIKSAERTLRLLKEMEAGGLINLSSHVLSNAFKSSLFIRARETMELLAEGQCSIEMVTELSPAKEEEWDFLLKNFPEAANSETDAMFQNQAAVLLHMEGKKLFGYIRRSAALINPGEDVILVTHSPLIEAAMAIATNKWKPPQLPIAKGDIVVFNFDNNNNFTGLDHLRPGTNSQ